MKKLVIIILILLIGTSLQANENIILLKCKYSDNFYPKDRNIVININLKNKLITLKDIYRTGVNRTEYIIDFISSSKLLASKKIEAGTQRLEINRITGNWTVYLPVLKSQNKKLWNTQERKIGYSDNVQVTLSHGGTCETAKPLF